MTSPTLFTIACVLSAGIWIAGGMFKVTHLDRMVEVIRRHRMPFPRLGFWIAVTIELGGSTLVLLQQYVWAVASMWIVFLLIITPVWHGRMIEAGVVDFSQLVNFSKNVSIIGGLIALIALDPRKPDFLQIVQRLYDFAGQLDVALGL